MQHKVADLIPICRFCVIASHHPSGFLEDLVLEPNSIDTFVSIFCHTVPVCFAHVALF